MKQSSQHLVLQLQMVQGEGNVSFQEARDVAGPEMLTSGWLAEPEGRCLGAATPGSQALLLVQCPVDKKLPEVPGDPLVFQVTLCLPSSAFRRCLS